MTTFLTTKPSIPGLLEVKILLNGQPFEPKDGYRFGFLKVGDKIAIEILVDHTVSHDCYTLDNKLKPVYKRQNADGEFGVDTYRKNISVVAVDDGSLISQGPGWPNNCMGLDIGGKTYFFGIIAQSSQYFYCVFEDQAPVDLDENTKVGAILYSNPLRGITRVFTGKIVGDAKVHWSKLPFRRQLGFRAVKVGEILAWEAKDIISTEAANTNYRYEIIACTLVK